MKTLLIGLILSICCGANWCSNYHKNEVVIVQQPPNIMVQNVVISMVVTERWIVPGIQVYNSYYPVIYQNVYDNYQYPIVYNNNYYYEYRPLVRYNY